MNKKDSTVPLLKLPAKMLEPIQKFLEEEIKKLSKTKKSLDASDPFADDARSSDNSLEEDVDEQIGHFDTQIKAKFVSRQIVQFRKALSMIKIGRYGVCEVCGKMIDTDRLAISPETTICIDCEKEKSTTA